MKIEKIKNFQKLLLSILISHLAGFFGTMFMTASSYEWYNSLQKPFFNPPSWVFGPVWLILYTMIGISFYGILTLRDSQKKDNAIDYFILQLCLNASFTMFFFGFRDIGVAMVDILLLWLVIFFIIIKFYELKKLSAILLIPYFLWVGFAVFLNIGFYILNLQA